MPTLWTNRSSSKSVGARTAQPSIGTNQERIECQLDLSFDNIKPTLKGKPPKGCPLRLNPITLKLAEKA